MEEQKTFKDKEGNYPFYKENDPVQMQLFKSFIWTLAFVSHKVKAIPSKKPKKTKDPEE